MAYSKNKILRLIFIIILLIGCKSQKNGNYHEKIIGNWAYIDNEGQYCEMYIDSIEIKSQPETGIYHGPFVYSLANNQIDFNAITYNIEIIDCNSLRLINSDFNLVLEKIHFDQSISKDDINYGFFLRRSGFLVNKGIISIKEAYKALNSYRFDDSEEIETEEEIIP
jgi:hypothetical protein